MAIIDASGFVADLKEHAADHGFHVHDERHFVETYSMRQAYEADLHPEHACGGPLEMLVVFEVEPRTVMAFEDELVSLSEDAQPSDDLTLPLHFTWALPPLKDCPDLLVLATDLAGVAGAALPLQVSAIDTYPSPTDASERTLTIGARTDISVASLYRGDEQMCDQLERARDVCDYLLDRAPVWLDD